MKPDHFFEELCLGSRNVLDRLTWHRIRQETDEIAGMARLEGHADFAVRLEAANSGTMTGTRIDHDEWTLRRIDLDSVRGHNLDQSVVDRPLQRAAVHDKLHLIVENMRSSLRRVLEIGVAALSHDIAIQNAALCRIDHVFGHGAEHPSTEAPCWPCCLYRLLALGLAGFP